MLFKPIGTGLLALAFAAATLSAAPARADHDTAKIIAGIAAVTILGLAISESNRHDHHYVTRRGHNHHYNSHRRYYRPVRRGCNLRAHHHWGRHYHQHGHAYRY